MYLQPFKYNMYTQLVFLVVYNHLVDLIQGLTHPIMGVYFGDGQSRWSWEEILNKKFGFQTECATVCVGKETIFMKVGCRGYIVCW